MTENTFRLLEVKCLRKDMFQVKGRVSITIISSIFLGEQRKFVSDLRENLTSRFLLTLRFDEKIVQKDIQLDQGEEGVC